VPSTAPPPASIARHRATVAALARHRGPDDPDLASARRELRAANLEHAIREAVAGAPPLTYEQRTRLAALLRNGGRSA
jgi:hypothetical protein